MDEHTQNLIDMLHDQFARFQKQRISLEELQSVTEGISTAFVGSSQASLGRAAQRLAGALEHIRWMSIPEEQFSDAMSRIKEFEEVVASVADHRDGKGAGSEPRHP
jgi:hypothetical protein